MPRFWVVYFPMNIDGQKREESVGTDPRSQFQSMMPLWVQDISAIKLGHCRRRVFTEITLHDLLGKP